MVTAKVMNSLFFFRHKMGLIPRNRNKYLKLKIQQELEDLDLVFFQGKYMGSKVVQYLTFSSFSHIGMVVKKDGQYYIFECIPKHGAVLSPLSSYKNYHGEIFIGKIQNIQEDQKLKIKERLFQLLGTSYENFITIKVIQKFFTGKATKFSKTRYICSEPIELALNTVNISSKRRAGDYVYPGDFERLHNVVITAKLKV